jgi:rod shape-determining protein MreC
MAPPSTRRPGFSRRAQFGLFIGYVVAVAGILFAVLLLIIAMIDPRGFSALRSGALDATAPLSAGGRGIVRGVANSGDTIGNYLFAASQNDRLKRQLAATRRTLLHARALEVENQRLKRLLGLAHELDNEITAARIIGSSYASGRRLATLSAGSAKGIRVGQPVRGPEGLIGRVLETGRFASRVLLVTDGSSNVPVRLVRDGTPALATGRGDGTLDIKPLEVGANRFHRGDVFVTSGTGGIYPPNIPVAVVFSTTRDDTIARPIANPARVDYAIVQEIYQETAERLEAPAEAAAGPASEPAESAARNPAEGAPNSQGAAAR